MTILFIGSSGTLGRCFVAKYKERYNIVGMSRKLYSSQIANVNGDISSCSIPGLLNSIHEIHGEIEHVVYAANGGRWEKIGQLSDQDLQNSVATHLIGPTRLANGLANYWIDKNPEKHSYTIISSIAGESVFGDQQIMYATVKAGQNMLALQLAKNMAPIRTNSILPNSFPHATLPTEEVCDKIVELFEGTHTGLLIKMGPDNSKYSLKMDYVR